MNSKKEHLTMRSLPADDRPTEKMAAIGSKALSDAELLAVIIRSGSRSESALTLCQRLLAGKETENGLTSLLENSLEELMTFPGIGPVKAVQIKAALELGSRATAAASQVNRRHVRSPEDAICLLEREMRMLPREELRIILLDVRNRVIRIARVSEGGLSSSVLQPRDLFREAVKANAAALILAHNHPSGDASPSREDLDTTRRLVETGEMMGIRIVDHVILATGGSMSFKQSGLI